MRVEIVKPHELDQGLIRRWTSIQSEHPEFHYPFLTPDWTRLVAEVRSDVEVAVIEADGKIAGFFPYQRSRWNRGKPVGGRMADVQGIVIDPSVKWCAVELIRACRLNSWEFHSLPSDLAQFQPHANDRHEGIYIDLSQGYDQYVAGINARGSRRIKDFAYRCRRATREVGPLNFRFDIDDADVLNSLLAWKSAQYRRTSPTDVLSFPWVRELFRVVTAHRSPEFRSLLSAMYFGDELVAAEIGLCSNRVFFGWMAAYNRDFSQHSPGVAVMMYVARALPASGFIRSELGKNNLDYKRAFGSTTRSMSSGCVAVAPGARLWNSSQRRMIRLSRSPWMAAPRRIAKYMVDPIRGWLAFQ